MKIKDVITETGLTDRAIRLYIENGLVTPSCSENYAGRKNIDFTQDDVETLKNIATLRKAGFSINEIKQIRLGDEPCRKALEEFMEKTSQEIQSNKAVLEKLEAVAVKEDITMEVICESLNSVTQEKDIPETDIKLSLDEKIEKYFFTALASVGLLYIFGCVLYTILICKTNFNYLYPSVFAFDWRFFSKLLIVLFIVSSCVCLLLTYNKKILFSKRKKRLTRSLLISVVSIVLSIPFFFFTVTSIFTPNACSKTTAPKNYLIIDEYAQSEDITSFFPTEIHDYATYDHFIPWLLLNFPDTYPDSTKYYYKYFNDFFGGNEFTEIYTEWKLLDKYKNNSDFDKYYNEYKEEYLNMRFHELESVTIKTKGDWQCVYYDDSSEKNWSKRYQYRIFAYNDETETLRFIYVNRNIKDPVDSANEILPHYLNLEW